MALTETQENDKIEVVNKWNVQVRNATIIKKDGKELTRAFNRHTVCPDQDITTEPDEVKAICNAVWTDEVKAAWKTYQESESLL